MTAILTKRSTVQILGNWFLIMALAQYFYTTTAAELKKPSLASYFGKAPILDGKISPGEWSDATEFRGVQDWVPEFSAVTNAADLSLKGWVKHDLDRVYFAFEVTDDVLYGIETDRWLPKENSSAHVLTRDGFPWFGDEIEILLNAPNTWNGHEGAAGNGASWQMVCNLTKSRLGGIGTGGLLEGEPRSDSKAWDTYQAWIKSGAQEAVAIRKPGGRGYIIEWAVRFDPCVEIAPARFYSPSLGEMSVGLNIALGDLDTPARGEGNYGNFHHEQWWAGARHTRTQKDNFGTLRLMGKLAKSIEAVFPKPEDKPLRQDK
jgi:SSS family solute:Na+ symporter